VIYLLFIALATVLFHDGLGADVTAIIGMTKPVAVVLPVLLAVAAIGSQFSAAIADNAGAGGLLEDITHRKVPIRYAYLLILLVTVVLTWSSNVNEIIAYASRAFALYYTLQCVVAFVVARQQKEMKHRTLQLATFASLAMICLLVFVLDFDERLGSEFDYLRYALKWEQNFTITNSLVFQYRYDGQYVDGRAPFYELPYINLRGFPRGLYANDLAMTLQGQLRWDILTKWTVMFFGGGGRTGEDFSDLDDNSTQFAGGTGLRYIIDPESKLSIGADVAYGDDSISFYIQIGDFLSGS